MIYRQNSILALMFGVGGIKMLLFIPWSKFWRLKYFSGFIPLYFEIKFTQCFLKCICNGVFVYFQLLALFI